MMADKILLPNFLVLGAAKSGTTALFHGLSQHPDVFAPYKKELNFFNNDENYKKGVQWYLQNHFLDSGDFKYRGEATPGYLFWSKKVVARILDTYRDSSPKFIVIFRDPVARAYSAYWHLVHYGGEQLSFEQALATEEERMRTQGDELKASGFIKYAYFRGGCYATLLQPYLDAFPREQFLFLKSEDFYANPSETMTQIHTFLGLSLLKQNDSLDPIENNASSKMRSMQVYRWIRQESRLKNLLKKFIPAEKRYQIKHSLQNINMTPDQYPPMNSEIDTILRKKYQDEIQLLEHMTELDLNDWK